jgi:hypothetical protein
MDPMDASWDNVIPIIHMDEFITPVFFSFEILHARQLENSIMKQ